MTENVEARHDERLAALSRRIFVTYARADRDLVQGLRSGLQRLSHEVWIDDRLSVGQKWWDEILRQLRLCDVVVVAVSPDLLESQASAAERQYAFQLGKPFLPVVVRPVAAELLPTDLASIQLVDYSSPGPDAAFQLADALIRTPPSPALPDPLPPPPPVPFSYLTDLTDRVHRPALSLDEQLAVVARLRDALVRDHAAALQLAHNFAGRQDLYNVPARQLEALLAEEESQVHTDPHGRRAPQDGTHAQARQTAPAQNAPPGGNASHGDDAPHGVNAARPGSTPQHPNASPRKGWYADPTKRYRFRWFDRDWTDWVSNGVGVSNDPL